jgi:hypothetical protein
VTYSEFKREISSLINKPGADKKIKSLLINFLCHSTGPHCNKSDLLTRLERINQACEDIPTRSESNDELIAYASQTLSSLMAECESIDEWFALTNTVNRRLLNAPLVTVNVTDLFQLIEKSRAI